MMKIIVTALMMVTAMTAGAQDIKQLWQQVDAANKKDLPKQEIAALEKIVKAAEKQQSYGNMLKAELKLVQVKGNVSGDSLQSAVKRLENRMHLTGNSVQQAVYCAVLSKVYSQNTELDDSAEVIAKEYARKAMENPELLAKVKASAYSEVITKGVDSEIFGNDLLSTVGFTLNDYRTMHDYYLKAGNRRAACIAAKFIVDISDDDNNKRLAALDSLINVYGDLDVAGSLAVARYGYMYDKTAKEKYDYLQSAIARWSNWKEIDALRNQEKELVNPQFTVEGARRALPGKAQMLSLYHVRNLNSVTLNVYKLGVNGATELSPASKGDLVILQKNARQLAEKTVTRVFKTKDGNAFPIYEQHNDSIEVGALPIGVYLLEFKGDNGIINYSLYYVSDVFCLMQSNKSKTVRYAVVNATTGQPLPGAKIDVFGYRNGKRYVKQTLTCNDKGEVLYKQAGDEANSVFAYTANDKAAMTTDGNVSYYYYNQDMITTHTVVMTDRAIYRPGQTVYVAAVVYENKHNVENSAVAGKQVTAVLRDANYKTLAEKTLTTDEFGKVSVDFVLPESTKNGMFNVMVGTERQYFRVEEYKRPTFVVEFDELKDDYRIGDTVTVKGRAKSYSGMPIDGAKVAYSLKYSVPFWFRYYMIEGLGGITNFISSDTITTGEGGEFSISVPVTAPKNMKNLKRMFCNIEVSADVTDIAGETHSAQTQLPLPLRKGVLTSNLASQYLADSLKAVTFSYLNALGKNVEKPMTWRIDNAAWSNAMTDGKSISIAKAVKALKSGKHTMTAICEGDTLKHEFTIFRLSDKSPAEYTRSFFYQSASSFAADGKPVSVMLGSSDKDVHVFYSIVSGEGENGKVLEEGTFDISNKYYTRNFTYRPEYGNGITMAVAWVKEGTPYIFTYYINRPEPDNKLKLEWTTFRDKLTPGQKEEWTLTVKHANGTAADAQMMATMFDKSLDQITRYNTMFRPMLNISLPSIAWRYGWQRRMTLYISKNFDYKDIKSLQFSVFDESLFGGLHRKEVFVAGFGRPTRSRKNMLMAAPARVTIKYDSEVIGESTAGEVLRAKENVSMDELSTEKESGSLEEKAAEEPTIRENLNETAFFYPALRTDSLGNISVKFTLPEALTTWRFLGIAHTKDISVGQIEGEAVAQKEVMVQPNMPRFVRIGDKAAIVARIANLSETMKSGKATMTLIDPMTEKVIYTSDNDFAVESGKTTTATFDYTPDSSTPTLLVCKVMVKGEGFGDGEQHYLPILPDKERVTKTVTFTQTTAGTKTIDIERLFGTKENAKLTVEYTDNPAWLVMQALPQMATPDDESAVKQAASIYANSIGAWIANQVPSLRTLIAQWKNEKDNGTSLMSNLTKNAELKDIVLNETPWMNDADTETEQRRMLATFFDENLINNRLNQASEKLRKLQKSDGSWSWMPGMDGSSYITTSVAEMLVRINTMTGKQQNRTMLDKALRWLDKEAVKEVEEMKRMQKKYKTKPSFPSYRMLQYIYLRSLDNSNISAEARNAINYLMPLLKKEIKNQSMCEKAMTAVILQKRGETAAARSYVQSLKEYTVYREDMGRYYDTQRAGYSWRDYRIPTQVMAIMAIQSVTPADRNTVSEMQRWLLQEKRTQAWDTPLNSVDAIYAFIADNTLATSVEPVKISIDNKALDMPAPTAGIGYRKTAINNPEGKTLTAEKTSNVTSWGSVYAQFMQPATDVTNDGSEIEVKREMFVVNGDKRTAVNGKKDLKVGDKVVVKITVTAARDLDFVQVTDCRAACMEPVSQLSGYSLGCYVTPKDSRTNYYFDRMAKGKHVVETEYHIDRAGTYTTGTCTAECAYAPEFRAVAKGEKMVVN